MGGWGRSAAATTKGRSPGAAVSVWLASVLRYGRRLEEEEAAGSAARGTGRAGEVEDGRRCEAESYDALRYCAGLAGPALKLGR